MSTAGELEAFLRGRARRRARDLLREVYLVPRRAAERMAPRRALPSFLLVGAQKSGTTSLFDMLVQHPRVLAPKWKEPRYFDRYYGRGLAWYRAHFPPVPDGGSITGEATTGYLFHPHAAERIARTLPDAKIVAVLRNPVDRAISHFLHEQRRGGETRPIMEALQSDLEVVPAEEARMLDDPRYESSVHWRVSYVSRGIYAPQLARYLDRFPRERIRVLRYDELFASPGDHYADLLDFLDLAAFTGVELTRKNVGAPAHEAGDVDREWLRELYRPHNEALSDLLDRDFTDWS